ncbi:lysozyme inhibitor LprI family protein [Pseudomonas duriflava]|uniref:lysozyme inhibitor LprI family protein n=1 Tax=Pseudomonas duriflava TaxID=459528 RepID=UPI0013159E06|nr:lysozyme inhibitor LprI family protein [Pseudomonas duriflava]
MAIPGAFFALASMTTASAKAGDPCNAANTEAEMYECVNSELIKSDLELNIAYKTLIARYQENGSPSGSEIETQDAYLKKAQIAWIKQRDASCRFETYESVAGSGFDTIYTACLLEQTQKRVEYLKWFIQHP